jgi:hypothetical protein
MEREIMADTTASNTGSKTGKAAAKPRKAASPRRATAKPTATKKAAPRTNRTEAKSRFNAALEEARAGAAALGAGALERAGSYRSQATARSSDWADEAKTRATELAREGKTKAAELAREGKSKASEALTGLSRVVSDNAPTIDDNLGKQYGDYARTASQSLQRTATALDQKSVEELGEDAREMVRKSPAAAVGLAALAGFVLARLFRR